LVPVIEKVMVGLGNPGERYARNRHNVGFMVLRALARRLDLTWSTCEAQYTWAEGPGFALIMPLTFMNCSGEALVAWAAQHSVPLTGAVLAATDEREAELEPAAAAVRPLVVCDDLALPLGSVRFRARGSSGGQNGLASVIGCVGGAEFPRLRLGVGPLGSVVPPGHWPDYVLADFTAGESEAVEEMLDHTVEALAFWLAHDLEGTASRFNRRVRES